MLSQTISDAEVDVAWWWGEGAGLMLSPTISDAEVDVAWWWGEGGG